MRLLSFIALSLSVLSLVACAPSTARTSVIPGPIPGPISGPAQTEARPVHLGVGQDMQLEVTLNGRDVPPNGLNWTSSDARVVSVSAGGLARAATAGQASVRASQTGSGRILAEFRMQVTAPPLATPQRLDAPTGQVLELSNAARARGQKCGAQNFPPVPPLNSEARLGAAAQTHAANMAALNYFSHTSRDGRTLKDRIDAAGYGWRTIAENIAAGQTSAQEVVAGWLNSEGHCRNLMNAEYRELGIGLARNAGGKLYWVQDFGTR